MGDDSFLRRTRVALLIASMTLSASQDAKVQALSTAVLNDSDSYLVRFAQAICAQIPDLGSKTTDESIQSAVNIIFPMIAGV